MRRALREICRELQEKLEEDTNTLLRVSSRDSSIRSLAAQLNTQLRLLRDRRHKYQQGDRELKEAITNICLLYTSIYLAILEIFIRCL